MLIAKTQIMDDDYSAGGSGQWLRYDPMTDVPEYVRIYGTGTYDPSNGSWAGTRFVPAGSPPGTPQLYGVVQTAALELEHDPFTCASIAAMPFDPDWLKAAHVNLSPGTITQTREDLAWQLTTDPPGPDDGAYQSGNVQYCHWIGGSVGQWRWLKRTVTVTENVSGVMGLAAIVKETDGNGDACLVARPICTMGVPVSLTGGGVLDVSEAIEAMRAWAVGRCFGFEWFLLPGAASISEGEDGGEGGLGGVLGATSGTSMGLQDIGGTDYMMGSAWVTYIEYKGFDWQSGRVTLDTFELPTYSRTPPAWPPRMD